MAGRRTVTNSQIQDWLLEALALTDELALPEWAELTAFNALLNAVQIDDHLYSNKEAVEAVKDALTITNTLVASPRIKERAFAFALTGTTAREVSTQRLHLPGHDKPVLQ